MSNSGNDNITGATTLGQREKEFASLIFRQRRIARREIHQLTGVHPTLTGNAVAALIETGLVREGTLEPTLDRGRPQVPLEVDPHRRTFLGLSIAPGAVRLAKIAPNGELIGTELIKPVGKQSRIVDVAAALLSKQIEPSTFSIGISFTGVVDPRERAILFSSSLPSASAISLAPLFAAAGDVPVILHNDMHALAVRWLLTSGELKKDVLLVGLIDGSLGASLLLDGQPHEGSVSAANEIGHMRLPIATELCYCGHEGCFERIISTPQLARFGATSGRTLDEILADAGPDKIAIDKILDYLAICLSNAVNFIRPEKLVIASPLVRHPSLSQFLRNDLSRRILPGLRERVELVFWEQSNMQSAENAAWLALADVFGHSIQTEKALEK